MSKGKVKYTGKASSQNLTGATQRKERLKKKRVKKLNNLLSKVRPPSV